MYELYRVFKKNVTGFKVYNTHLNERKCPIHYIAHGTQYWHNTKIVMWSYYYDKAQKYKKYYRQYGTLLS